VGLLMPVLSGVQRRSKKATELNDIKQVHYAWGLYANNSNDAALPGYLERDVQAPPMPNVRRGWNVKYDYPTTPLGATDNTIPPAPGFGASDENIAGPWVWRLASYLDYNHQVLHGYADETDESIIEVVNEAKEISEEPSFGYNGYYIGGWWEQVTPQGGGFSTPFFRYYDHCGLPAPGVSHTPRLIVPTTISQIRRSAEMVTFCSATKILASESTTGWHTNLRSDRPGWHLITPPAVANDEYWRSDVNDPHGIVTVADEVYAPLGRYTGFAATLWADGHCDAQSVQALDDQRKWINNATSAQFRHDACPQPPPP
jgi:hypothetical protein